ncbi:MAG: PilZ domain-containing protein [Spirochaetales bacterium]|nr:PilZ domain-containing protein [Spirochaetales bacterium]
MSELSSQKLNEYYDRYKDQELAFNKSIISALGVEPRKICLKIKADPCPCVLYSCSMIGAKIIIHLDNEGFERIKLSNNFVNLRLSFYPKNAKNPLMFFVPAVVKSYRSFELKNDSSTAFLMTLDFTTKPSEDLIEILGKVFEMNENFEKRKALRIDVDEKLAGVIGFATTKAIIEISIVKQHCLLKNISATGVMALMACNPPTVLKKKIKIHLVLAGNPPKSLPIEGTIMRCEPVVGNKTIFGLGIMFDPDKIPYEYKTLINNYIDKLETLRKKLDK